MISSKSVKRLLQVTSVLLAGTLLEVSCTGMGERVVNGINPCGTILNCDPVEYDLLTRDFPNWELDPTCTIPGQCGTVWPLVGGTTTTTP